MFALEGVTDPAVWAIFFGTLGPAGFALICVVAVLFVVFIGIAGVAIALTGIPRWGIPGLAWALVGIWKEIHGYRQDERDKAAGKQLEELEPWADSAPGMFVKKRAQPEQKPVPVAPPSRRRMPSRS